MIEAATDSSIGPYRRSHCWVTDNRPAKCHGSEQSQIVCRLDRSILDFVKVGPILVSVDRDVFAKVSRLSRDAARQLARALDGEDLDPSLGKATFRA